MPTRTRYIADFIVSSNDIANGTITFSDLGLVYTSNITENTNLFFTNTRARTAISVTGSGSYDNSTGIITITGGVSSVNGANGAVVLTTANIAEQSNLYYTNNRVYSNVISILPNYTGNVGGNLVGSDSNTLIIAGSYNYSFLNTGELQIPVLRANVVYANTVGFTTSNITEGTNLYYTNARARTAITVTGSGSYNNSTGVITITGGVSSVNGANGTVVLTTANIAEQSNLYYTNARVRTAISVSGNLITYNNTTGVITITADNVANVNKFYYTATSNQTIFAGADDNGRILSLLKPSDVYVFLNGVLLVPTIDYSANSSAVVFTENVAASSNVVFVDTFVSVGPLATANIRRYTYNSTEGQTIFSGADRDGQTLFLGVPNTSYVYLNGILLTSNNDYNAYTTNVTFTTGVSANSTITVIDALLQAGGYASEAFVTQQITNLIDAAPGALDTLNELAAALGDDANFSTTVLTSLSNKANVSQLTTANVTELTNLYYTNARVYSNVIAIGYSTAAKTYAFTRIF